MQLTRLVWVISTAEVCVTVIAGAVRMIKELLSEVELMVVKVGYALDKARVVTNVLADTTLVYVVKLV